MSEFYSYTAQELIQTIETAFFTIKYVHRTLEQNYIIDKYGMGGGISIEEYNTLFEKAGRNRSDKKHWQEITDHDIMKYDCPFCNMNAEEFAYYLPAHMCYALRNVEDLWWESRILISIVRYLSIICEHDKKYDSYDDEVSDDIDYNFSAMTAEQKKCVLLFAIFVVDLSYGYFAQTHENKSRNEIFLEDALTVKNLLYIKFGQFL